VIKIGGLQITAWDTPGHARHHHTFILEDIAFTGDVGAVRLPGCDWISLPAPPPEFKLEVWLNSIDRVQSAGFRRIYPTHFGPFDDVSAHWDRVRETIVASAEFVADQMRAGMSRGEILVQYAAWNRQRAVAHGVANDVIDLYEIANPLYMSVDGIMRYWSKKWERGNAASQ
jgi:glyoxylase-like metal-dependent hydrolase (beta-lactamase superfamily II)